MCELMEKNCKMLELLKGNFEEDENGIDLSLGLSIGRNYSIKKMDQISNSDDKRSKKRAIHRELMENEELNAKQKVCRKGEIGTYGNECCTYDEAAKSSNLSLNQDSYVNNQNLEVQFWAHKNGGKRESMKKNYRGFRLYNENMSYNQCGSSESEENLSGKSKFKNYRSLSNGSSERCSSTITECQSSSPKGRSTSDNGQGIQPCTSGRKHPKHDQTGEGRMQIGAKMNSSKSIILTKSDSSPNPTSTNQTNSDSCSSSSLKQMITSKSEIKNGDGDIIRLLSRMPCVSARGNGPNGKTINGLLCKYDSKMEISIVCVCHGKLFTPCEFVEHAGGVNISQPLRHITVISPLLDGRNPL